MSKKELNIFKLLSQKPWEPSQAALDNEHDGKTLDLSKAKLGVEQSWSLVRLFFLYLLFLIQTEC